MNQAIDPADVVTPALRVLVIDDSENDVALAEALLAAHPRLRFDVQHATTTEEAERFAIHKRGGYDVVLHGLRDDVFKYHDHLRHLIAALGACPLVVSGEFWDDAQVDALATLGVHAVLPKVAWTEDALSNVLLMAVAHARRRRAFGHDVLTGLPGRGLWRDRLQHALDRCGAHSTIFSVMLVDIDDFKGVNDTLGHESGDLYLREVAKRLCGVLRDEDTVARLGGDEFALLIEDLPEPNAALSVAAKVIEQVCRPVELPRAAVPVSISVGVAIVSAQRRTLTSDWVYQAADSALYEAKRSGKNRFSVHTDDMDRALVESLQIEDELMRAAASGEFALYYQPIVSADSGGLQGFEALMRWESPDGRRLLPGLFVPILERLGLMDDVGLAVLEAAVVQIGQWRKASGEALVVHVNLSAAQLLSGGLGERIRAVLDAAGVSPSALVLEIAEDLLLRFGDRIARELDSLRAEGLALSITDFGTGFTSLQGLRQVRPDQLKIHRSFVRQLEGSPVDGAIVRAQGELGRALGMCVVAEGVESLPQLEILRATTHVDQLQGYHLGAPVSVRDIARAFPHLATSEAASSGRLRPSPAASHGPARRRLARTMAPNAEP